MKVDKKLPYLASHQLVFQNSVASYNTAIIAISQPFQIGLKLCKKQSWSTLLINEGGLKNEDNLKYEEDLKCKDNLKYEDDLKYDDDLEQTKPSPIYKSKPIK